MHLFFINILSKVKFINLGLLVYKLLKEAKMVTKCDIMVGVAILKIKEYPSVSFLCRKLTEILGFNIDINNPTFKGAIKELEGKEIIIKEINSKLLSARKIIINHKKLRQFIETEGLNVKMPLAKQYYKKIHTLFE